MSVIAPDKTFSDNENRALAQIPKASLKSIADGSFTSEFENYAQDQLICRDAFMRLKTRTDMAEGKKDNGSVYFGKDGCLFAIEKIDDKQLEKNIGHLKKFLERLEEERLAENEAEDGKKALEVSVMIVPTATEIMKEQLPKYAPVPDERAAIEKIKSELGNPYRFVDVAAALEEHSDDYIFYNTDHHWTTQGAWYAFEYWRESLAAEYGSDFDRENGAYFKPLVINDYNIIDVSYDFLGTNYSKAMTASVSDVIERFDLKTDKPETVRMTIMDAKENVVKEYDSMYVDEYLKEKDKYSYFIGGNNPIAIIERFKEEGAAGANVSEQTAGVGVSKNGGKRTIMVIKDSYAHCFIPFLTADYDCIVAVDMRYYHSNPEKLIAEYGVTDILFLYNILNFSQDTNLLYLNK